MNKRFFIAWLVVFIAWFACSWVVHGVLLHPDYVAQSSFYRSEAESQQLFHFLALAHVLMAGTFVWIYARGVEARPWIAQGLRFGLVIALLTSVPWFLIYYTVMPLPGMLVAKQIVFESIQLLILGVITAFFYREPVTVPAAAVRAA
jgi:hypothetical protein